MYPKETRPLAQAAPYELDGDLVLAVADREARISGDLDAARRAIGFCNGRRTISEIAGALGEAGDDAAELLETLLAEGVLDDSTAAYRAFHKRSSIRHGFYTELDEESILALEEERFEPAAASGETIALEPGGSALLDLCASRRSTIPGDPGRLGFTELSRVLAATYRLSDGQHSVPSAGGIFPLVVHLALRQPLGPLEAGVWWLDPWAAELHRVGPIEGSLDDLFTRYPLSDELLEARAPVVFISADLERPARKYANRGYRYVLMEVGAAMQNAYLAAAEMEVPIRAIGGIDEEGMAEWLGLGGEVSPLLALLFGS
jgi:SagB-type dehydrogenase family enzyme